MTMTGDTGMRVLVAGATGVIGRELLPILTAAGHEAVGLSRSAPAGAGAWIAADALDRGSLTDAVGQAAPQAVVNLLTSIPAEIRPRRLARDFETTGRLRTEGTRNLLDAAKDAGVTRMICEGLAYVYDPGDASPAAEDAPLWRRPPRQFAPVARALNELERHTARQDGLVLRFGHLYGPGTAFAEDGSFIRKLRAGKVPVVGNGGAVFSFVHTRDAAAAVAAAVTRRVCGVLNVVDDVPVVVRDWLPELARMTGAPAPRNAPAALARLAAGGWGVACMTRLRGADNTRARHLLGWEPRYASWRDGFSAAFAAS
jgi:nucleoside-diphosphate-sugar epimerase